MPRNGSGSYNLPNGPFVPSTVISSTVMNQNLSDLGTALTQSIANDGQTTPVANLPMATFRHTNVGNAVARNDYAAAGQVQDSSLQWLTSVAGTNTITAAVTPSPTVYVAGQTFRFVSAGANTGAVTLNINGLGAKAITKRGTVPLVAGDIPSGLVAEVVYDGTQFQLTGVGARGALIGIQRFTASGTYTPSPGANIAIVRAIGGGGGGGGSAATGAGTVSVSGGGNSGAFAEIIITSGLTSTAVTIGAGGAGSSGAAGADGGTTSFGTILVCPGGKGSSVGGPSAPPFFGTSSTTIVSPSGTGTFSYSGPSVQGESGVTMAAGAFASLSGHGAPSPYGAGGTNVFASGGGGSATANTGAGGGGALSGNSQPAFSGGSGGSGLLIVYEYA